MVEIDLTKAMGLRRRVLAAVVESNHSTVEIDLTKAMGLRQKHKWHAINGIKNSIVEIDLTKAMGLRQDFGESLFEKIN